MDTDKLNSINPHLAIQAAFQAVDSLQQFPAHQQLAGVAVLFNTVCDGLGIDPSDLINKAQRITKDADGYFTREAKALRDYVQGELK